MRQKTELASQEGTWHCAMQTPNKQKFKEMLERIGYCFLFKCVIMNIMTEKTYHVLIILEKKSVMKTFTERNIIMTRWDISGNFHTAPHTQRMIKRERVCDWLRGRMENFEGLTDYVSFWLSIAMLLQILITVWGNVLISGEIFGSSKKKMQLFVNAHWR